MRQPDVDFSNTFVEVSDENGENLEVKLLPAKPNKALPNIITWKINQIKEYTKYSVTIKNVKVFDTVIDYKYWFRLK